MLLGMLGRRGEHRKGSGERRAQKGKRTLAWLTYEHVSIVIWWVCSQAAGIDSRHSGHATVDAVCVPAPIMCTALILALCLTMPLKPQELLLSPFYRRKEESTKAQQHLQQL